MPEEKQNFKVYLLDTNHAGRIIKGEPAIIDNLSKDKNALFVSCVIVVGELFFMVYKSKKKDANTNTLLDFLNNLDIYPIDQETSRIYGEIKANILKHFGPKEEEKRRKVVIEDIGFTENDLWIAAIAKQHDCILVSGDSDFKRMQETVNLKVEQWWHPEQKI